MRIDEYQVRQWLKEAVGERVEFTYDVIHVSEVTQCLRKSYYQRRRASRTTGLEAVIIIGSMIHLALQDVLRRYGFRPEFRVGMKEDGVTLIGHIDAYDPDRNIVLEFKTVNKIPKDWPWLSHEQQAVTYATMVDTDEAYIIYIDRGTGEVEVYQVGKDQETLEKMLRRAKILSRALRENEPPEPERGPWCNYCPWKWSCFKSRSKSYYGRSRRYEGGRGRGYDRGKYYSKRGSQ